MNRNKKIIFGFFPSRLREKTTNRYFIDSPFEKEKPQSNQQHFNCANLYYTITSWPLGEISKCYLIFAISLYLMIFFTFYI